MCAHFPRSLNSTQTPKWLTSCASSCGNSEAVQTLTLSRAAPFTRGVLFKEHFYGHELNNLAHCDNTAAL